MAKPLRTDDLWRLIEPLLPRHAPSPQGGRPRVPPRSCLTGILFVLKTGIPWEDLPREMGCGSGMTCWRRLRDWHRAGAWRALHELLLAKLRQADRIDWSRAVSGGGSSRPQPHGSRQTRVETPCPSRRRRQPAGYETYRGQPPRRDATVATGRGDSAGEGQAGSAASQARSSGRRPSIRFAAAPGCAA